MLSNTTSCLVSKYAGRLAQELAVLERRSLLELGGKGRASEPHYDQEASENSLVGREQSARAVMAYGDSLYVQHVGGRR